MRSVKAILQSRLGNFVPKEVTSKPAEDWSLPPSSDLHLVTSREKGLEYSKIAPDDSKLRGEAAAFMSKNFFREAVVPAALRLASSEEQVRRMVLKEIDLFLDSGTCVLTRARGEIVACYLGLTWTRDKDYDVVDCSMLEWHNAAAEIAMELDPERPQIIWRDYQYQHLYNATQALLETRGANCAYYYGLGYVAPQLRGRLTHEVLKHHPLPSVVTRVALNTMQHFEGPTREMFQMPEVIDSVNYEDQKLVIEGARAFKKTEKFGRMALIANSNTDGNQED